MRCAAAEYLPRRHGTDYGELRIYFFRMNNCNKHSLISGRESGIFFRELSKILCVAQKRQLALKCWISLTVSLTEEVISTSLRNSLWHIETGWFGSMNMELARKAAVIFLALGIAGCAGIKATPPQLEAKDEVANLAAARWALLIKGDVAKAYEFLSPGTRKVMSLDVYKARIRAGGWKSATVNSVTCEKDVCKVVMAIDYTYRNMPIDTLLDEDWLQENGKWWYSPRK
jgi:hypothetical protein